MGWSIGLDRETLRLGYAIVDALNRIATGVEDMNATFDALVAQVAENVSVEASAVLAIQGIADKLEAALAANVPSEEMQALIDQLKASADPLAAAVAANTAPVPAPDPAPVDDAA